MKKLSDVLAGLPMTIVGGVFLGASLAMMLAGIETAWDPAWITVFICGIPLVCSAATRLIFQRWISSALLISIAMIAAIAIGELFAAGEVAFIMALGAILEDMTAARAKKGIGKLLKLAPQTGRIVETLAGKEILREIPAQDVRAGDRLRVLPGETIPADGTILAGATSVDQSIMTGESLPVDKKAGDAVFCGTMNCFGSIDFVATRAGKDSSLQKMIDLVKEAESKKAPMQRIVDKWAAWLVPIALLIAVAAWLATGEIVRGVTVLVVFCPCALALAAPTSIMAAIGQATKKGVLIKSGEALENMGKANRIVFDKTGTLTCGKLEVSDAIPAESGVAGTELLRLAAGAELRSEHPLGKAIVLCAESRGVEPPEATAFSMSPGKGVSARIGGADVLCASEAHVRGRGIPVPSEFEETLTALREDGKAVVLVVRDGILIGAIALSDALRNAAPAAVARLKRLGAGVSLLTGDHAKTARRFAALAGIDADDVKAELLPDEKVAAIRTMRERGEVVCMVGDGVNDAPALKTADVGVAMGGMGSDIALEAADVALMGDDVSRIPYLKRLANATVATIKFNIVLSMTINFVAITLSTAGLLNPVAGALVHNAGSVLVVLNAALLYDRRLE